MKNSICILIATTIAAGSLTAFAADGIKLGPVLASGCSAIIKPSSLTPLATLAAAKLSIKAGLPPGVINVPLPEVNSEGMDPGKDAHAFRLAVGAREKMRLWCLTNTGSIKRLSFT